MKPFHPYILVALSCVLPCLPKRREVWEGVGFPLGSGLPEAMPWRDANHVIPCAPRGSLLSDVVAGWPSTPTSPSRRESSLLLVTLSPLLGVSSRYPGL